MIQCQFQARMNASSNMWLRMPNRRIDSSSLLRMHHLSGSVTCLSTGAGCITSASTSCVGLSMGDYQACESCTIYHTCDTGGVIIKNRPCPAGLVWLATGVNSGYCDFTSSTCTQCVSVNVFPVCAESTARRTICIVTLPRGFVGDTGKFPLWFSDAWEIELSATRAASSTLFDKMSI